MPLKPIRFGHIEDEETIKNFIKDSMDSGLSEEKSRDLINKIYAITKKSLEILYIRMEKFFDSINMEDSIDMADKLKYSIKVNFAISILEDALNNNFINDRELSYMIKETIKRKK